MARTFPPAPFPTKGTTTDYPVSQNINFAHLHCRAMGPTAPSRAPFVLPSSVSPLRKRRLDEVRAHHSTRYLFEFSAASSLSAFLFVNQVDQHWRRVNLFATLSLVHSHSEIIGFRSQCQQICLRCYGNRPGSFGLLLRTLG